MIRVLLISYYFPPCGAIGSKRWGEMFEILSESNEFDITVLTANWDQKNDLTGVNYVGDPVNYTPPKSIVKKNRFFSRLKHPSEYFRSLAYETIFGKWRTHATEWIDRNSSCNFDLVLSSFSPVSAIVVGNYAKQIYGSKLIIDLRDLLSLQGQKLKVPIIDEVDKLLDKYICRHADLITTIGPTTQKKAQKFYNVPVRIIYNGYLNNQGYFSRPSKTETLNIGYFGTIGYNRSPSKFYKLLSSYLDNDESKNIILHIASNDDPLKHLYGMDLNSRLVIKPYGYLRGEPLKHLYKICDCYLLLEDQTDKGIENLTGKIFEYIGKGKPIIASCNNRSDIVKVLNDSGAGMLVSSQEELVDFINKYENGFFYSNTEKIQFYSRKTQADKLVSYIHDLLEEKSR